MADPTRKIVSTSVNTEVVITVSAMCPVCFAKIELTSILDYHSLVTGNATQSAGYHADRLKERVDGTKKYAMWETDMCGACRVKKLESEIAPETFSRP